jgi:predicted O-linked N-acetylglucosamine transferase (SPINDLY family)
LPPAQESFERALSLLQAQDFIAAERCLSRILKRQPEHVGALNVLAIVLARSGRHIQAEKHFRQAIRVFPSSDATYYNYGITLKALGRLAEAHDAFTKSLALNGSSADAWNNRGTVSSALGRFEDAIADFDKAIALAPRYAAAYGNKGKALAELQRREAALAAYLQATALGPDLGEAFVGLGNVLRQLARHDEALLAYDRAISLNAGMAEAWFGRGQTLMSLKQYALASDALERAITLMPDIDYGYGQWLHVRMQCCRWDKFPQTVEWLLSAIEAGKRATLPFPTLAITSTLRQQRLAAEIYAADNCPAPPRSPAGQEARRHAPSAEKIRIGYFSADFHNHATTYLAARLFELHDRSQFDILGFSYGPEADDEMRRRLQVGFDELVDVKDRSDRDIADLARTRRVDIAVDLKGYTERARTGIFAQRAAPIQVSYLGYPGTMGSDYFDYIVADRTVVRPEDAVHYSEKIAWLPHSYQVNDDTRRIANRTFSRAELGLPSDAFVLCCFNNSYKITPDVFEIWMRLLSKVDGGVLWLFEGNAAAVEALRAEASQRGVSAERLVFAPRMDAADHLARHGVADLFLDTFPYNAHTTASDALWAGLPLVTRIGDTFAGRVAASLLKAVGLPELIAETAGDYEKLALELATNREKLATFKQRLDQNRLQCPLFDTALFTRHIEMAYRKMWERYRSGLGADHLVIEAD